MGGNVAVGFNQVVYVKTAIVGEQTVPSAVMLKALGLIGMSVLRMRLKSEIEQPDEIIR